MGLGILVIDDHHAIAQALTVTLAAAGFDWAEALASEELHVAGAVDAARRSEPDVVLVDLNLGAAGSGLPIVRALCQAGHTVVVFTASNATSDIANSLRAGAVGFVNKSEPFDAIVEYAKRAAAHDHVIDEDQRRAILEAADADDAEAADRLNRLLSLTDREREILAQLAEGLTVKQIAQASSGSVGTVRVHVDRIRKKLDVDTQFGAVAVFREFNR